MVVGNKYSISIVLVLGIICAWVWTEVVLYSANTLINNGRWTVSKRLTEVVTMGGDEYLITRLPLAGNRLHLASWYGFQEVHLRDQFTPGDIRFRFRLEDRAYFYVTYGRHESRLLGVRFSRKPGIPSAITNISPAGQFENIVPIAPALIEAGWHEVLIKFERMICSINIDGDEVFRGPREIEQDGTVGFRGGFEDAEIDDVRIWGEGKEPLIESFRNTKQGWVLFLMHLAGLLSLLAILLGVERARVSSVGSKMPLLQFSLLMLLATILGSVYLTFDYAYWSRLPLSVLTRPLPSEKQTPRRLQFENLRFSLFGEWYQLAGGLQITKAAVANSGYPKHRIHAGPVICRSKDGTCRLVAVENLDRLLDSPRPNKRVIFAGTSQTIGSGAKNLEETFFVMTHRHLAATLSPLLLESINISISAVSPPILLQEYEQKYLRLKPDLLVINLGTNGMNEELAAGLSGFLEINRSHHISTVMILEPNSPETETTIKEKHQIMRSLGERDNVPIIDLQAYLSDPSVNQSGALWWDFVHLTSYGHSTVAKWLSPQLLPYLKAVM